MNEEEKFKEAIKELKDSHELHQQEWAKRCLDTIVDLYNQEKEKNKKLEEEIEKFIKNHIRTQWYYEKKKLYEKVIDMMAKDLVKVPINDYMSETQQEIARYINRHLKEKKETIKQYYFKKARGEENETN